MADKKQFTLMLVDDEPWALIGLRECIDWEEVGFKVIASCDCGMDALAQASVLHTDAVITDIRMPDISGLELIRRLKEENPALQCAVVSAFSDFELAREAIRLTASGYIMKPLSVEEVTETAREIYRKLENQHILDHKTKKEWVIDEEAPSLPRLPEGVNAAWLIITEEPSHLKLNDKNLWIVPVVMGNLYGIFTEKIPEELPSRSGISWIYKEKDETYRTIETAKKSLNGQFRYPEMAGMERGATTAAEIQIYLYDHMKENISLKKLEDVFFLTETYLCDFFKKETDKTILGFLRDIRMNKAADLLARTDDNINEIALKCGYKNHSYFGSHFKSAFGFSPDAYRKTARRKSS